MSKAASSAPFPDKTKARLTSLTQDPLRILLCSLPVLKTLSWLSAKSQRRARPQPRRLALRPRGLENSPGWQPGSPSGPDSPGRWRSAGAPGCLSTACWKGALGRAARQRGLSLDAACSLWVPRGGSRDSLGPRVSGPAHGPPPRLARPRLLSWPGSDGQSPATGRGPTSEAR